MPEVIAALKNKKAMALIFVWGWVLAPALGYLITMGSSSGRTICNRWCSSPVWRRARRFLPLMVAKARGDISFAGAFIPLAMIGAVVFIPLIAPLMVKGVTISPWALAKPLLVIHMLLPLAIGTAARHYAETAATEDLSSCQCVRPANHIGDDHVSCFVIFAKPALGTVGSFALLAA